MKKEYIVKKTAEFSRIINKKQRINGNLMVLYYEKNKLDHPRFGISIGKKNANAVYRNKNKRQLKEIISKNLKEFKKNADCIIIMKKVGIDKTFAEKEQDLIKILNKLGQKEL